MQRRQALSLTPRLLSALLEPIGYVPPPEAEANSYRQFANQATTVVT
jgi:hypothetical protein